MKACMSFTVVRDRRIIEHLEVERGIRVGDERCQRLCGERQTLAL